MVINNLKIATPISDLFLQKENADLISKYSDCLECRDHSILNYNQFISLEIKRLSI